MPPPPSARSPAGLCYTGFTGITWAGRANSARRVVFLTLPKCPGSAPRHSLQCRGRSRFPRPGPEEPKQALPAYLDLSPMTSTGSSKPELSSCPFPQLGRLLDFCLIPRLLMALTSLIKDLHWFQLGLSKNPVTGKAVSGGAAAVPRRVSSASWPKSIVIGEAYLFPTKLEKTQVILCWQNSSAEIKAGGTDCPGSSGSSHFEHWGGTRPFLPKGEATRR